MKIGDTVTCEYHGKTLTGKIDAFDFSGVYVKLETSVEIYGIERDEVYLWGDEAKTLKLVKENDPVDCEYCTGFVWKKGPSKK